MKDIVLKITGKTISMLPKPLEGEEIEDPIEFVTEGKLLERGNIRCITYEESDLSGMPGCTTSLIIMPNKVKMKRTAKGMDGETLMEFEEGKRHSGIYETPYGMIPMEVLANKITFTENKDENIDKMSIEYAVSLKGLVESRKQLNIEVVRKN